MLRQARSRAVLLDFVGQCERLVLLGDVLELRHGPLGAALSSAEPVLREIGQALGPGREAVIVAGNHDHHLVSAWMERRPTDREDGGLGLAASVDWRPGEILDTIAGWLTPATVQVSYPGIWLRGDVYATHGHYSDRHTTVPMFERLGAGLMARIVHEPSSGPCRTEDYEAILAPIYAWVHAVAQTGGPQLASSSHGASSRAWRVLAGSSHKRSIRRLGLVAAFPVIIAALNSLRLGPLHADVSGVELRRAALRAFDQVLVSLGVEAEHVVFGHTHRAGPLPADNRSEWLSGAGAWLLNTGSWVHEPAFLGSEPRESPYRPGFCAIVEGAEPPRLLNLLDPITPQLPA